MDRALIAFCADARGPRATSGQGRAHSTTREYIHERPALSANNWRARCRSAEPRRRGLTLHSKTSGPSKCSYRLIAYRSQGSLTSPCPSGLSKGSILDLPNGTRCPRSASRSFGEWNDHDFDVLPGQALMSQKKWIARSLAC
jgi:hypothetical protein